jgi:rsbT co-antagonist protein RsbR
MHAGEATEPVILEEERLERLKNAVAFAAAGAFDQAIESLALGAPDRFSEVEEMLRLFFGELKMMTERVEEAVFALETSKQELLDKLATIEAQRAAIQKLSTPIVDAWEGVIALPLVGLVDAARAREMSEKLLRRIAESRARWVIIDLTGVEDIDVETAEHLVRLSAAVKLLGSRCLLTGIGSKVAGALVVLGKNLGELKPLRSLQEGLRYCLAQELGEEKLRRPRR